MVYLRSAALALPRIIFALIDVMTFSCSASVLPCARFSTHSAIPAGLTVPSRLRHNKLVENPSSSL
jgi:hypothetical protein